MLFRMDDQPLTEEQLLQLRQNLARLSESSVKDAYQQAHKDCEMKGDNLPKAFRHSTTRNGLEAALDVAAEAVTP